MMKKREVIFCSAFSMEPPKQVELLENNRGTILARMDFEFYTSITRVREKVFVLNRNKRYEEFLVENFEKY